jgi:hypothetical protein
VTAAFYSALTASHGRPRRRPDEVPALNGEFEFIAVTTPEVIEAA